MKMDLRKVTIICLLALTAGSQAGNLIINGSFDDPKDPLRGWTTDYAWTGNSHYMRNTDRVSVVPQESGRTNVMRLERNMGAGVRVESMLIPFSQGERYRATLRVKGGRYRIYFAGYRWRPGVRPHANPELREMRQLYRSRAETGRSSGWSTVSLEIPGVEASPLSLRHLSQVRFITLYLWFEGGGFVDDVVVTRISG